MDIIENIDDWRRRYSAWQKSWKTNVVDDVGSDYPFVKNRRAPFDYHLDAEGYAIAARETARFLRASGWLACPHQAGASPR